MLVEKLSEIQNSHLKIRESIQFLEQSLSPQDYNDQTLLDDLYRNLEGLETPKIKLPIIGRVKAGKSTLLSAIMGPSSKAGFEDKPPLHIDTNEATAVVIDIEYGENVEVFLKKMNPDGNYDEKVIDYERYLEDYKVSIDAEENRRKFKNVIGFCVKYPNELLKSGLILQDLPGLEMHDERTEISLKVIRNSSFGVFVFNKHFTKDQDAASIFQEFRKENCRIITVFNDFGFDLRREQGRESKRIVVQQFYKLITGNTCIIKTIEEADEIIKELEEQYETFFVSAKSAWEGKLEGDQQEIISSGILKLEQLLATLVGDEMKEKIKTDAEQRIFVRLKARKVQLQEQIEQLNRSKTASEGRVIAQQKNVANRQEEYDKAKALIIDHRDQTKKELKESFSNFIDRLVTMIVNYGYTFSGDILDKITLANRLNKVIGDELNHWENSEVSIIIQRYKALLNSELEIIRSQYDVKETGSNLLENNSNNFREDAWEKTTNSVKSLFTVKEDTVVNKVTIDNSEAISFGALGIAFAAMAILGVIFLPLFTVLLPKLGFFIFTGKRVLQDLDNITYRVKSKANSKLTEARLKTGEKIDEIVNKQYNEVFIALDNYIAVIAEETKIVVFVAEEEAKKQKTIEASIKTSQAKEESLDNCINDITSILN